MKSLPLALTLLIALTASAVAGTQYYLKPACEHDGNGLGLDCAASAGAAGAFNGCTTPNTWTGASGTDLMIYAGSTVPCQINWRWFGADANDKAIINPYNAGNVNLGRPVFDGSAVQTGWTQYGATAIYSADNTATDRYVVAVNGVRLRKVSWNTNIATTAADMAAGTFAHDDAGDKLYIWTTDSANPTTKTVTYANVNGGLNFGAYYTRKSYQVAHGLDFKMHHWGGFRITDGSQSTLTDNSEFYDINVTQCGRICFRSGGNNTKIHDIDCSDQGVENEGDVSCIMTEGGGVSGASYYVTGMELYNNHVHDTRSGSCYELNFGVRSSTFRDNRGDDCGHQFLEVYQYSNDNTLYNLIGDNEGFAQCAYTGGTASKCQVTQGTGLKFANNSTNNKVYNSTFKGFRAAGLQTGAATFCGNTGNRFWNITLQNNDADSAYIGIGNDATCSTDTGNEFKNIIIDTDDGEAVQIVASGTTLSNNIYHAKAIGHYMGTEYAIGATAAFKTASGDSAALFSDPLLNADLTLQAGSPAIGAGADLSAFFTTDLEGSTRTLPWDIGAIMDEDEVARTWTTRISGATLGGN